MSEMILSEYDIRDFETITVSSTAIGFTATKIKPTTGDFKGMTAVEAFFTVETAQIRFRCDGTDPTSSVGHLLSSGDSVTIRGKNNVNNFKAIRVSSDATIQVSYRY